MLCRTVPFVSAVLAVCATAHAGIIAYSINGGAFVNVGVGGTFNTNGDTGCGIAANCNEFSGFNINNAGGSGINLNGAVAFTTTDFLGNTLSALEQMTLTVDNTNVGGLPINVIVAVVSDTFDPSLGGPAGVGIFGTFLNDGGGGGGLVTADAQGEMDYYDTPAGGVPNGNSFALVTPLVGEVNGPPTPFWTFVTTPGSPANIESLVGFAGVDVGGNSVVSFPVSIEDNDTSFLQSETPEPGSYLLFGSGLAALGLAWRKRLGSLSQR